MKTFLTLLFFILNYITFSQISFEKIDQKEIDKLNKHIYKKIRPFDKKVDFNQLTIVHSFLVKIPFEDTNKVINFELLSTLEPEYFYHRKFFVKRKVIEAFSEVYLDNNYFGSWAFRFFYYYNYKSVIDNTTQLEENNYLNELNKYNIKYIFSVGYINLSLHIAVTDDKEIFVIDKSKNPNLIFKCENCKVSDLYKL